MLIPEGDWFCPVCSHVRSYFKLVKILSVQCVQSSKFLFRRYIRYNITLLVSCLQASLVSKLKDVLRTFERSTKKRENEELRRKRLAYVGISLANVLPESAGKLWKFALGIFNCLDRKGEN